MPDLPQDQLCQIHTDRNPKADTQTCLEERGLCVHPCLPLIKKYVPCQPNVGCYSNASPDSGEGEGAGPARAYWVLQQTESFTQDSQAFNLQLEVSTKTQKAPLAALLFLGTNCQGEWNGTNTGEKSQERWWMVQKLPRWPWILRVLLPHFTEEEGGPERDSDMSEGTQLLELWLEPRCPTNGLKEERAWSRLAADKIKRLNYRSHYCQLGLGWNIWFNIWWFGSWNNWFGSKPVSRGMQKPAKKTISVYTHTDVFPSIWAIFIHWRLYKTYTGISKTTKITDSYYN